MQVAKRFSKDEANHRISERTANSSTSIATIETAAIETCRSFRLINYKQLRAMGIDFSREHLYRLEAARQFPRRVRLSAQKIAWIESEVISWLQDRASERATRIYPAHD
jgi:prophage regulatory protein